jgi:hypothetical protein
MRFHSLNDSLRSVVIARSCSASFVILFTNAAVCSSNYCCFDIFNIYLSVYVFCPLTALFHDSHLQSQYFVFTLFIKFYYLFLK